MSSENQSKSEALDALKRAFDVLLNAPAYTDPAESFRAIMAGILPAKEEAPVTHEQWEQIYEVTKNIRLLELWKCLHDSERITLLPPGRDEPVYPVVMGNGEMVYGIGIYPGYDSLRRLLEMMESPLREDDMSVGLAQNCINLYFGNREELDPQDRKIIKSLGLKFRGRNEWPYFRSMKPGFVPWYINSEEADLVIAALQNFVMAARCYGRGDVQVDFEDGETLLRFCGDKDDVWYNTAVIMPPAPFVVPKYVMTDDALLAQLKKEKKTDAKLGLGLTYLPGPVQENKNERPRVPQMAMMIELNSGIIVDCSVDDGGESIGATMMDSLTRYITKYGRPASIVVPDDGTADCVSDFAEKLGVELTEDEKLSAIIKKFMGRMTGRSGFN